MFLRNKEKFLVQHMVLVRGMEIKRYEDFKCEILYS